MLRDIIFILVKKFVAETDDYSNMKFIDVGDNGFEGPNVSHNSDDKMKILMKGIINLLFPLEGDDPRFDKKMDYHKCLARIWGDRKLLIILFELVDNLILIYARFVQNFELQIEFVENLLTCGYQLTISPQP